MHRFPSSLGMFLRTAPRGGWGPAAPFNMCFVYQDRGPSPFIPNGRAHSSYALSSLAEDETEIKSGLRQSLLMRPHSPEQIVRELSLEDRERFEQFVLPHVDAAFNLARWRLRERSDAEDVTQDALLRANRFFWSFHGSDARAWLMKIARNRLAAGNNGILRRLGRRPCRPGTAPH